MHFYNGLKIGMLGGGQLGKMLLQAAMDYTLDIAVLDPDAEASCSRLTPDFVQGSLTDYDTVYNFGKDKDLITIEIENVNIEALEALEKEGKQVYPQPRLIRLIQDKRTQKQFFQQNGIPTAPFALTENAADVQALASRLPFVNKIGKGGYDGRGVEVMRTPADLSRAFDAPGLVEALVPFEKEIAVIVARNAQGEIRHFAPVEMVFHPTANLVEFLFAPADINAEIEAECVVTARRVAEAMEIVGVLAVEMFITPDQQVLVNEVAPRPHNSGHHTIRANATSQYEQHLRAILGLPLGDTQTLHLAGMVNLLGAEGFTGPAIYEGMNEMLAIPGVFPLLYGKKITKPFRKMGHVTILDDTLPGLKAKAERVRKGLKVVA